MYEMYVNHQDGNGDKLLWSDNASAAYQIISPSLKESIDEIPTFDFTILPNHPEYNNITKFKTTVKVIRSGRLMFYGRVMADGKDMYGQKSIACEGALSFLKDSVQAPVSKMTETPLASFTRLIQVHNSTMPQATDGFKHFTVGQVTIDDANTAKSYKLDNYGDTMSAIDALRDDYHGFLRARLENGTLYVDWLKNYNRSNAQPIKMAVNLLEISNEETVDEYYTVLFPIGNKNKTIESENSGSKYLTDTAAVTKYGTIIHPEDFDESNAASLLEKAQKKFNERSSGVPQTINVTAVDMKLVGKTVDELLLGDTLTNVEGYENPEDALTLVEIDRELFDPSKDQYVLENKAALDKRLKSGGGNGRASSRLGGMRDALDSMSRDYYRSFNTFRIDVTDSLELHSHTMLLQADEIKFSADKLKALAGEYDWSSATEGESTQYGQRVKTYIQSYRHQIPSEIADTVQAVTGYEIDKDGLRFGVKKQLKKDEQGNQVYEYEIDPVTGHVKQEEDTDPNSPTYGKMIPVYKRDESGNRIPEYEFVPDPTREASTIYSTTKRTATQIESTVGTLGIQLDPKTGKPFTDNTGNYIYVETRPDGTAILNDDGTYKVIDFPDGTITSKVKQNKDRWEAEVRDRRNADDELAGSIEVLSNKVSLVVTESSGDNIINRASIIAAINEDSSSSVTISADKIDLQGYVTAEKIFSEDAQHESIYASDLYADDMYGDSLTLSGTGKLESMTVVSDSITALYELYLDETDISNALYAVQIIGPTNNVYTLQAQTIANAGTQTWNNVGTFSRAISSWSSGWNGSTYTVTASPQNLSYPTVFGVVLSGQGASSFSAIAGETTQNGISNRVSATGYLHEYTVGSTNYVGVFSGYDSSTSQYTGQVAQLQISSGQTPDAIVRTGYNTTNKTVTVKATSGGTDVLTGIDISATELWDDGYSQCWSETTATVDTTYNNDGWADSSDYSGPLLRVYKKNTTLDAQTATYSAMINTAGRGWGNGTNWPANTYRTEIQNWWRSIAISGSSRWASGYFIDVDATPRYGAGWNAAIQKIVVPSSENLNNNIMTIQIPQKSPSSYTNPTMNNVSFSLHQSGNYCTLEDDENTVLARLAVSSSAPSASRIDLNNFNWANTEWQTTGSTKLGNLGTLIQTHKNDRGYIYFDAQITGGTGKKRYYISIG